MTRVVLGAVIIAYAAIGFFMVAAVSGATLHGAEILWFGALAVLLIVTAFVFTIRAIDREIITRAREVPFPTEPKPVPQHQATERLAAEQAA